MEGRNRTISLLYEAAVNPSLWPFALAAFADLTQCRDVIITVHDKLPGTKRGKLRLFMSGGRICTPESNHAYGTHYYSVDPLRGSTAFETPTGTILLCQDYVSQEIVAKSEFYQDYLLPLGGRYVGGWMLVNDQKLVSSLILHARHAPFESKKVERWGSVAQHARHAVLLSLQMAERASEGAMLRQVIDHAGYACFMVDADFRLIDCSKAAAFLLQKGSPFTLRDGRRLATVSASETKLFHRLVTRAVKGCGGVMRISNHEDGSFCVIQATPGGVATENPFDPRHAGCALIFVGQASLSRPIDVARIRVGLKCTQAEAEVAVELTNGISPAQIAADRGVSVNTVRTQIRALLTIAGVNRITKLISLLGNVT